jgi:ribosomal protein S18 acetylase RimI-like enzyme
MAPASPSSARIRDATEADIPRLLELLAQLTPDRQREEITPQLEERYRAAFRAIESDPRQRLLVAEVDGLLAGTLVLVIVANLTHEGRPYALVENVVVDERLRGSGHGEALMRYAMAEAQRAGCYKLVLTSNKRRAEAHRFYRRIGMEATSEGFRVDFA